MKRCFYVPNTVIDGNMWDMNTKEGRKVENRLSLLIVQYCCIF